MGSSDDRLSLIEYPLNAANIHRHYYTKSGHCLVICCRPNLFSNELEIALMFQDETHLSEWESALQREIQILSLQQRECTERAVKALTSYVQEKIDLQTQQLANPSPIKSLHLSDSVMADAACGERQVMYDSALAMEWCLWKVKDYHACWDDACMELPVAGGKVDIKAQGLDYGRFDWTVESVLDEESFVMVDKPAESPMKTCTRRHMLDSPISTLLGSKKGDIPCTGHHMASNNNVDRHPHSSVVLEIPFGPNRSPTDAPSAESPANTTMPVPIPRLCIAILVVGTRGDVQPFVAIGLRLASHGHRVRLATHACFRDFVLSKGLEFFPLAGDPLKLSEFMVKTQGWVVPTSLETLKELPENMSMIAAIIDSCWPACVDRDPADATGSSFVADAIISNPVTYGHIHCAEALGVPLHVMFPQPWCPTKAFPHPLSCLRYDKGWCAENYLSYQLVDRMLWLSMEGAINGLRKRLGLDPIRSGERGWDLLNAHKIPFVKMWSPLLAPRPKDWGDHIDVVGTFPDTLTPAHSLAPVSDCSYSPTPELAAFLAAGPPPVFIGFGSMVYANPAAVLVLLMKAAAGAGVRVIIQEGWSRISEVEFSALALEVERWTEKSQGPDTLPGSSWGRVVSQAFAGMADRLKVGYNENDSQVGVSVRRGNDWLAERNAFLVGPVPHEWLFPRVAAVVHHGGAGTTAAGLKAGRPTLVVPFFGDQHFWGAMVHRAGVGPPPCPVHALSVQVLQEALDTLLSTSVVEAAASLGAELRKEDGCDAAVEAFYRHLPLTRMLCDVSLFRGQSRLAVLECQECGLRMCREAEAFVHRSGGGREGHAVQICEYAQYGVRSPARVVEGVLLLVQKFQANVRSTLGVEEHSDSQQNDRRWRPSSSCSGRLRRLFGSDSGDYDGYDTDDWVMEVDEDLGLEPSVSRPEVVAEDEEASESGATVPIPLASDEWGVGDWETTVDMALQCRAGYRCLDNKSTACSGKNESEAMSATTELRHPLAGVTASASLDADGLIGSSTYEPSLLISSDNLTTATPKLEKLTLTEFALLSLRLKSSAVVDATSPAPLPDIQQGRPLSANQLDIVRVCGKPLQLFDHS